MAFNAQELASIANAALDYYFQKGTVLYQSIQARPLLDKLEAKAKTFPGGKGDISVAVKGNFGMPVNRATNAPVVTPTGGSDTLKGYTHDDQVSFYTPDNILRANYPWREHHIGLTLTHTELKIDGISVSDTDGKNTSNHSGREMTALVNLLEDKLFDLGEQYSRGLNGLLWGDGTADPKALAGLKSILTDDPTTGTVGGIDRSLAANTWWRHHALVGANSVASAATGGGVLWQELQKMQRQLTRYGGRPDLMIAGSDFINALEVEARANGYYSDSGFTGGVDGSMGAMKWKGTEIIYDPTLDDMGEAKRMYWVDTSAIRLFKMENEWRRQHSPSRPHDHFVLYRSITNTGQLVATRCNSSAVVEIS